MDHLSLYVGTYPGAVRKQLSSVIPFPSEKCQFPEVREERRSDDLSHALSSVQPFPSLQHPFGLVGPINLCYCKAEIVPHALEPSPPHIPPLSLGTPQLRDRDGMRTGTRTAQGLPVGLQPVPTSSQPRVIRGTIPLSTKNHKS